MKLSEEDHPKLKLLLIAILVSAILVGGTVFGLALWQQQITWTWEQPSFDVVGANQTVDFGVITESNQTQTETYTVVNTGNVPVTVQAYASGSGVSWSWNQTLVTLGIGEQAGFALALNITGQGSLTVTFDKV